MPKKINPLLHLLLLLSLGLSGCSSEEAQPDCVPISAQIQEAPFVAEIDPLAAFTPSEIVVGGPTEEPANSGEVAPGELTDAVDIVNGLLGSATLELVDTTLVVGPDLEAQTSSDIWPVAALLADNRFEVRLYRIVTEGGTEAPTVEEVLELFAEVITGAPYPSVFAEANNIAASPIWGASGDPGGTNPDPNGGKATLPVSDPKQAFQRFTNQWAFQTINRASIVTPPMGDGIRVFVFDTAAFPEGKREVSWVSPTLTLCVSTPFQMPASIHIEDQQSADVDAKDHGVFASGLIHQLAPASSINLVRVMNNQGVGDVYTFIKILRQIVNQSVDGQTLFDDTADKSHPLQNTVLNFSLGIKEDENLLSLLREISASFEQPSLLRQSCDPDILTCLFKIIEEQGGVSVAAAGNDSNVPDDEDRDFHDRLPTQAPASYDEVTAIAASTANGRYACFSNQGSFLAPGGSLCEYGLNASPNSFQEYCSNPSPQALCDQISIIGPVSSQQAPYESGFAYWRGTSFATPIASALAAIIMDQYGTLDCPNQLSPTGMREILVEHNDDPNANLNFAQTWQRVSCRQP